MSHTNEALFVRKKKNKSGVVSIQIIDKSSGKYRVIKTVGSSSDTNEIERLFHKGLELIPVIVGQTSLNFARRADQIFVDSVTERIKGHRLLGPSIVLGRIFDEIGFNTVSNDLFRHLVISRLVHPVSKLKTVEYLNRYQGHDYDVDKVYRYLDQLNAKHKATIQQISYQHTLKALGCAISVVFYDVTTIYFEAEQEDDLRKTGFSKDGKAQNPQIVLGLLVSRYGYPLAYEIFEGNKFEGHTMIPVLESFKATYQLKDLVVVADAGLLSSDNIERLKAHGFRYILGARLKNETQTVRDRVLSLSLEDGNLSAIRLEDKTRLIVSYSEKRARKDVLNRERGLKKLEKALAGGKLTKRHINNRGYNKYLKIKGDIDISIDYEKYDNDRQWDGLKGYITNTDFQMEQVIDHYRQLWLIEKAFRISKTDLRIRPVYHRLRERIEAHICISFCAYKIYKELERQLRGYNSQLSPEKVIEILNTIYVVDMELPNSQQITQIPLITDDAQRHLIELFKINI